MMGGQMLMPCTTAMVSSFNVLSIYRFNMRCATVAAMTGMWKDFNDALMILVLCHWWTKFMWPAKRMRANASLQKTWEVDQMCGWSVRFQTSWSSTLHVMWSTCYGSKRCGVAPLQMQFFELPRTGCRGQSGQLHPPRVNTWACVTFPLEFRPCTWEGRRSQSPDASHVVVQVTWHELALLATATGLILTMASTFAMMIALMTTLRHLLVGALRTLLLTGTSTRLAMSGSNALSGNEW